MMWIVILRIVLYGCETWSLKLKEERRLRVFENRVLRRILGPRRDEVTRDWRILHNEELYALYFSLNIIQVINPRRLRWTVHIVCTWERKGVYRVLVGKFRKGDHLEDQGVGGSMLLKWVFEDWDRHGLDTYGSG
jgi:hypothetical protein